MHDKAKQGIEKCLNHIRAQTFDEDIIFLLMLRSRDFFEQKSIAYELSNFLAHPKRKAGPLHNMANINITKFRLIAEQNSEVDARRSEIHSHEDLSRIMLGKLNVESIDAKIFDLIYMKGIEEMDEKILLDYTAMNKKTALFFVKEYYKKKDGVYYLDKEKIYNTAFTIFKEQLESFGEKSWLTLSEFKQSEIGSIKVLKFINKIDQVQKTVRGYIKYTTIPFAEIKKDFIDSFQKVIKTLGLDVDFLTDIKNNISDIFLCILAQMHDTKLHFDDTDTAETYLTFYHDYNIDEIRNNGNFGSIKDATITLFLQHAEISFPLIVSDIPVSEYFDFNLVPKNKIIHNMHRIQCTNVLRVDGKLKLSN